MFRKKLLSIPIHFNSRKEIFYKIEENIKKEKNFIHIVSLNPEIVTIAQNDDTFSKILSEAEIQICDGTGVYFACRFLGIPCEERVSGVDLMEEILQNFHDRSLCVVLLGGKNELANKLAECYRHTYSKSNFIGLAGYENIKSPTSVEEMRVQEYIHKVKPDIVFVAFGSPEQERWIDSHRALLNGAICMGVGGGFDFLGKQVPRAPYHIRQLGLEWFFRLIVQPWRIFRQIRLLKFVYLVLKQKMAE